MEADIATKAIVSTNTDFSLLSLFLKSRYNC